MRAEHIEIRQPEFPFFWVLDLCTSKSKQRMPGSHGSGPGSVEQDDQYKQEPTSAGPEDVGAWAQEHSQHPLSTALVIHLFTNTCGQGEMNAHGSSTQGLCGVLLMHALLAKSQSPSVLPFHGLHAQDSLKLLSSQEYNTHPTRVGHTGNLVRHKLTRFWLAQTTYTSISTAGHPFSAACPGLKSIRANL